MLSMAAISPPKPHNPDFKLSARQEQLLFAALNSNNPSSIAASPSPPTDDPVMASVAFSDSPIQPPGSASQDGFDAVPFLDYDNEFDTVGAYDFDLGDTTPENMDGKSLRASLEGDDAQHDLHDKRNHDEVDDNTEGGGKRREGEERIAKKPGRKLLTNEPTTKRKAQNRAAQRAFRERKEQHLQDLETKVDDLQKASEAANHENTLLRAQVDKMSVELREYKRRVTTTGGLNRSLSNGNGVPSYMHSRGVNNPNDVNFQFEFPRFGMLPGPSPRSTNDSKVSMSSTTSNSLTSPVDKPQEVSRSNSMPYASSDGAVAQSPDQLDAEIANFSGLFSPGLLQSVTRSTSNDFFAGPPNRSSSSTESVNGQWNNRGTNYSSPSASSNSNAGATSSCGTSPEPSSAQSPKKMSEPSLTTIGEENFNLLVDSGNMPFDVNGIDWLAQQNGNQFDPQLFGDYREPIDNILSNDMFTNDNFFSEAFSVPKFSSPSSTVASSAPKKDLLQQMDEKQNEDEAPLSEKSPKESDKMLKANTIWDRLQTCPKVADGTFDLDSLCDDLKKKAKCSETGWVLESEFNHVIKSHFDKEKGNIEKKPGTI